METRDIPVKKTNQVPALKLMFQSPCHLALVLPSPQSSAKDTKASFFFVVGSLAGIETRPQQ